VKRDETKPPPGWELVDEARGKYGRVGGLSSLARAWREYDAEHPRADLSKLHSLADRWNRLPDKWRCTGPVLDECARELREALAEIDEE